MRTIVVKLNTFQQIEKLVKIMNKVLAKRSNDLPEIAKFNWGKTLVPSQVDRAELHIETLSGTDIVEFPRKSLSFLIGNQPTFSQVSMNSEDEIYRSTMELNYPSC